MVQKRQNYDPYKLVGWKLCKLTEENSASEPYWHLIKARQEKNHIILQMG